MADQKVRIIIEGNAKGAKDAADKVRDSLDDVKKSASASEQVLGKLGGVIAGLGFVALANSILKVNIQMESLRIQLESVTGSARKGATAFNDMLELARNTPFEIADVTKAYLILKNSGLEPTHEVMDAITNQASKLGGRQEDLTAIATQLGQAYAKATLQMVDIKIIAEHGVPIFDMLGEATGKTTSQIMDMSEKGLMMRDTIDKLIVKMGELSAGSNQRAMATLGGQISMLGDAWHKFEDALLQDKSESLLKRIVEDLSYALEGFAEMLNHSTGIQYQIDELDKKIFRLKNSMNGAEWHRDEIKALQAKLPLLQNQLELEKQKAVQEDAAAVQKAKNKKANEEEVNKRLLVTDMRKSYGSPEQKMELELQEVKAKFKAYNMDVPQDVLDGIHVKYAKKLTQSLDKSLTNSLDAELAKKAKLHKFDFEAVDKAFKQAAATTGIDEYLLKAQAKAESQFNPRAKSPVGAMGFSQFMPGTAKQHGLSNPYDPVASIFAQAKLMADNLKKTGGNIALALAAYNGGMGAANYLQENPKFIQNPDTKAPSNLWRNQTADYVKQILAEYEKSGGTDGAGSELVAQFESSLKLAKNEQEAFFKLRESALEQQLKQTTDFGSQQTENLNGLKESGKISAAQYWDALTASQAETLEKQIAIVKEKTRLALEKFNTESTQSEPENLPTLKANFQIEQGSLEAELQRLKDELAKVGINVSTEKDKAAADARNNLLQTRASLLVGTQAGEDAQEALQLDEIARAYNAAAISLTEFEQKLNDVKNQHDETFQSMVSMGEGAASALEKGFSDILFDPLNANFREIALAFLSTLRRMLADAIAHAAIKAITNAIMGVAGAATGGWGGIITGIAGAAAGAAGGGGGSAGGYHTGGIVGNPKMHFNVSPLAFASAARYHSGGLAGLKSDEVPAVLQRGEEVLTRNDPRHRYNGGGNNAGSGNGGGNVTSIVVMDPAFVPDAMAGQVGSKVVINHIRDNASSIKRMLDGA